MSDNSLIISVGIFVYNGSPFIREAIQSIVDQTYKVDEIVISDNCSTDDTLAIIEEFKEKYRNFIWAINKNEKNLGFIENAKKVISMASGHYLLILHADDILKADTIEKQISILNSNKELALVGGFDDSIDKNSALIKSHIKIENKIYPIGSIYEFIKDSNSYIPFSTVMHRLSILREIGIDFSSFIGDELYWPKVLQKYPIAILGTALTCRRYHDRNTTSTYSMNFDRGLIEIERHLQVADYEPHRKKEIQGLITYKYANNSLSNFLNLLFSFQIGTALRFLLLAFKLHPSIFLKNNFLYQYLSRVPIKVYKLVTRQIRK